MKKIALIMVILVFVLSGCAKTTVDYSKNFQGVPIYPGTELLSNSNLEGNAYTEVYYMDFKGKFEDVKKYYETNIDKTVWKVEEVKEPIGSHGVDEICAYTLTGKDQKARLTLTYSDNGKVPANISVTIIGEKN